jgi:hypothetical protein
VLDWSSGDLNQDGIEDIALMITENDQHRSDERIVVLKKKAAGGYELMAKSLSYDSTAGTAATRTLSIKNNSLFARVGGPSDFESVSSQDFQFKWRNNDLCLIGLKYFVSKLVNKKEGIDDQEISINYLTGEKVEWKKVDMERLEVKSKIPVKALVKLEQFDWSLANPKDHQFSIDHDFKI